MRRSLRGFGNWREMRNSGKASKFHAEFYLRAGETGGNFGRGK